MSCGTYNFPWLVQCTSQVYHVVPRSLCLLACYGPPHLFLVGEVVCYSSQIIYVSVCKPEVVGVTLIVVEG